jgi:pimeloyl-ACP methyl ester carboxylesterase
MEFAYRMETISTLVKLDDSPLAGSPSEVSFRLSGSGLPVLFLHGGWGYEVYPLKPGQFVDGFKTLIPDRSGYGRSTKPAAFGRNFHQRAAQETLLCLNHLGIDRCIFWGHSDGAVIAAMIGLSAPERCAGIILEALHYDARKGSHDFFRAMISAPDSFGHRATTAMAREHGEPYWRELLAAEGKAWGEIAAAATDDHHDLFSGRLSQLSARVVIIHGERDPRTEPGELDSIRRELPHAPFHLIPGAGHSPHSETASSDECTRIIRETLNQWKHR